MDLPSFIWLWRIAAWSMGLSLMAFGLLAVSGGAIAYLRRSRLSQAVSQPAAQLATADSLLTTQPAWLRPLHYSLGGILVGLVLLLLTIGLVGTLGEYGHLGHSLHLPAGLTVVGLTLGTAWCAIRISPARPWARRAHLILNGVLFVAFILVTATGWSVVQKYL